MDLSYKEQLDKLQVRIRAHKQFANFDVGDWIEEFTARKPRRAIFDLGCGNGNHLGIYLKHIQPDGRVAGLDREPRLIAEARASYAGASALDLRVGSMDDPLPFADAAFDLAFSNFAIYNASDPAATLRELHRVLTSGGELVLIGPTMNNALELYQFNEALTGVAIDPVTLIRTDRLRREIQPLVASIFESTTEEVLNSSLRFPSADEFLLYFRSTMVYEETAEKRGITQDEMCAALKPGDEWIVSKEMLAVIARKL